MHFVLFRKNQFDFMVGRDLLPPSVLVFYVSIMKIANKKGQPKLSLKYIII